MTIDQAATAICNMQRNDPELFRTFRAMLGLPAVSHDGQFDLLRRMGEFQGEKIGPALNRLMELELPQRKHKEA